MKWVVQLTLFFSVLISSLAATTIYVPDDYSTIQDAINASANGDTVIVRSGMYFENIDYLGKVITVMSESGPQATIIDGSQAGSVVTFQTGEALTSVLEGFTLTNGTGTYFEFQGSWFYCGGGIFCNNSSPTIRDNIILNNTAEAGGGVYGCSNCSPHITDNVIQGNSVSLQGGGILMSEYSSPLIEANTVTGNSAVDYGGGIEFGFGCAPTIDNNIVTHNSAAQYGGGGIVYGYDCGGTVSNNLIAWNTSGNGYDICSGGIGMFSNCTITICDNFIYGNSSERGGGIEIKDNSTATIVNTTIYGNSAVKGGGINVENGSSAVLMNNTLCENTSTNGGGIRVAIGSTATITNNILWQNQATNAGPELWIGTNASPSTVTISYSDVKGGQAVCHVGSGCTLNWGPGMIDADPLFVDAANGDFHLTWNSPCRDIGDNSAVTQPYDFEGDPRIALGTVDMGADEYYYHLYHMGDVIPGSPIDLKVVGYPSTPVTLCLGSGIQDPPLSTQHGDFWLNWPPLWQRSIGTVPGDGILVMPATVPTSWSSGSEHPLQALVGPWGGPWTRLTNMEVLVVGKRPAKPIFSSTA